VPFDFLRRKREPQPAKKPAVASRPAPTGTPVPFDGVTDEWRLIGQMYLDTRLSDALNRREALAIANVSWAPIDGSSSFSPVPGLRSVDPHDFIVVLADESSKGGLSEAERAAHMGQRVAHKVSLEAPPLRITGTVHLTPGVAPEALLERTAEMFVPVVGGVAYIGERPVSDPKVDAILVNRFYLRGVKETGAKPASATTSSAAPSSPSASSASAPSASASASASSSAPSSSPSSASTSAASSAATPAAAQNPKPPATKDPKSLGADGRPRPKRGGLGPRT
jgi:hypothetical protein